MASRGSRTSRKILFSALVAAAILVLIELLARGAYLVVPGLQASTFTMRQEGTVVADRILNHRWVPSLTVRQKARGIEHVSYHNSQSWVERYTVSREKPNNTFRIFYVGDSNVHGVVGWDQRMVELVEKQLNRTYEQSGTRIEVINTGTSSYSTIIYYLLIKHRILPFHPDLVVINVDMTDVSNDLLYGQRTVYDDQGSPLAVLPFDESEKDSFMMTPEGIMTLSRLDRWGAKLYEYFAFYRLVSELVWSIHKEKMAHADVWLPWHTKRDQSANWLALEWTESIERNVAKSMSVLGRTIALLKDQDIRVMVTGVPHHPQYTGEWSTRPHEVLAETAKKHDCFFLNSYEAMRPDVAGSAVTEFYFASDPTHLNAKGNEIWSRAQVEFLLSHRAALLP